MNEPLHLNLLTTTTAKGNLMQNELILRRVAHEMDANDLWFLRSTCSVWNHSFIPSLCRKQKIKHLLCSTEIDNRPVAPGNELMKNVVYNEGYQLVRHTRRDCTELLWAANWSPFPFVKFRMYEVHAARLMDVHEFFHAFSGSNSITRLDLLFGFHSYKNAPPEMCVSQAIESTRRIIFQLAPNLVEFRFRIRTYIMPAETTSRAGRHASKVMARDLPNLRRLEFFYGQRQIPEENPACKNLLVELFRRATRLEFLALGPMTSTEFGAKNLIVMSLLASPHVPNPCVTTLTKLEIFRLLNPELEVLLGLATRRQNPLRLRRLVTSIGYVIEHRYAETLQLLYKFLAAQASTLRTLNLEFQAACCYGMGIFVATEPEIIILELPRLPAVHSFRLHVSGVGPDTQPDPKLLPTSFPLESMFPALTNFEYVNKAIVFGGQCPSFPDEMQRLGHSEVSKLSLNTRYVQDGRFLGVYGQHFRFQHLAHLQITLKAERIDIFTQICAGMPALKVLKIMCEGRANENPQIQILRTMESLPPELRSDIPPGIWANIPDTVPPFLELDTLLIGVPEQNLHDLRWALESEDALGQHTMAGLQSILLEHKTNPGLQDLRNLKKFVLTFSWCDYRLTDISGYFGFALASSQLQCIAIEPSDAQNVGTAGRESVNHISERCTAFIRSVFGAAAVIRF